MTPTLAERGLGDRRNHVCLVHDSPDERMRALEGEIVGAFDRGKRVLVLAESTDDPVLAGAFGRTGRGSRDGQVDARVAVDTYLAGGSFDPGRMLAVLDGEGRRALADGFSGVHVLADMSWAAGDAGALDRLPGYERAVSAVFADGTTTGVCQYDRTRFGTEPLTSCTAAHPRLTSAFTEAETIGDANVEIHVGRLGTVCARGELDLSNAELFERALAIAAERADDGVCVDASQLSFVDVRGLHALLEAARTHTLVLLAPSAALRTMLRAVDADRQLPGLRVG